MKRSHILWAIMLIGLLCLACGECPLVDEVLIPGDHPCACEFNENTVDNNRMSFEERVDAYNECVETYERATPFECPEAQCGEGDQAALVTMLREKVEDLKMQESAAVLPSPACAEGLEPIVLDTIEQLENFAIGEEAKDQVINEARKTLEAGLLQKN